MGIDAAGTFVVKIDTVGVGTDDALRAKYVAIRGPSNEGSPIAYVFGAAEGLEMTREELVDRSAKAIAGFDPSYDALLDLLELESTLTLMMDTAVARDWSAEWRQVMLDGAVARGASFWLPEAEIVADRPTREGDGFSMSFGTDPTSKARAVSFVDSSRPGSRHPLSSFAADPHGRRFLLHQARLNSAGANIVEDQFLAASGLHPTAVDLRKEDAARKWLRVADLDAPAWEIRRSTGRFVHFCALVRDVVAAGAVGPGDMSHALPERPWYVRIAPDEVGGTYVLRAREAQDEKVVERRHGMVSMRLREALAGRVVFRKLQHPLGFEIDGEVLREGAKPLLIEIKTDIGSSSIHAGIGQLHLYSRLIPGLTDHDLVLLLPKVPAPEVIAAIRDAQIEVHTYEFGRSSDGEDVAFSKRFLDLCLCTRRA